MGLSQGCWVLSVTLLPSWMWQEVLVLPAWL